MEKISKQEWFERVNKAAADITKMLVESDLPANSTTAYGVTLAGVSTLLHGGVEFAEVLEFVATIAARFARGDVTLHTFENGQLVEVPNTPTADTIHE